MRESEVAQSCPTLSDPMDCCIPGSSIHGIFQARVLEWGAIAFSDLTQGTAKTQNGLTIMGHDTIKLLEENIGKTFSDIIAPIFF